MIIDSLSLLSYKFLGYHWVINNDGAYQHFAMYIDSENKATGFLTCMENKLMLETEYFTC
jgi:hypothetical protein